MHSQTDHNERTTFVLRRNSEILAFIFKDHVEWFTLINTVCHTCINTQKSLIAIEIYIKFVLN